MLFFSVLLDGNCLFTSVSTSLCGNAHLHLDLRTLPAIELYESTKVFSSHYISRDAFHAGVFLSERYAFLCGDSNDAMAAYEKQKLKEDAVIAEALNILKENTWSSLLCVMLFQMYFK